MDGVSWFDELTLDPAAHPVAMGTRSLGGRPWLVADGDRARDLARKAELLHTHRAEVLHETGASHGAATELARLAGAPLEVDLHPLESAARHVQEDLCLLQRRAEGWYLDASCVCFPTRWRLSEKVNHHIATVHAPVDGYDPRIIAKVDRLFDRLTEHPVWRRNWFLMTDAELYQPTRPVQETIVAAPDVYDHLSIRSERQTLRRVDDGWIVFTIRIQQATLGDLLTSSERIAAFRDWVHDVTPEFGIRRHLTARQRGELLSALT